MSGVLCLASVWRKFVIPTVRGSVTTPKPRIQPPLSLPSPAGLRLGWVTAQAAIIEKLTMTIQVRS